MRHHHVSPLPVRQPGAIHSAPTATRRAVQAAEAAGRTVCRPSASPPALETPPTNR